VHAHLVFQCKADRLIRSNTGLPTKDETSEMNVRNFSQSCILGPGPATFNLISYLSNREVYPLKTICNAENQYKDVIND